MSKRAHQHSARTRFSKSTATIDDWLSFLHPDWSRRLRPDWPPDIFAAAASLLHKSGAYPRAVMGRWPPDGSGRMWAKRIRVLGLKWRANCAANKPAPSLVRRWWSIVRRFRATAIAALSSNDELCEALIQLVAAADEASVNLGLPGKWDEFEYAANELLEWNRPGGSNLCKTIDSSRLRVLPKMHTPQKGLTTRSLSHNLTLCSAGDFEPRWTIAPNPRRAERINLLLVPWPFWVRPRQFSPARNPNGPLRNMAPDYGFFDWSPESAEELPSLVSALVKEARQTVGPIYGVVLPELAMSAEEYDAMVSEVVDSTQFVVCGVQDHPNDTFARNELRFDFSLLDKYVAGIDPQPKHHRWMLDKNQIVQYGLGGTLDPTMRWWENNEIGTRQINFVALQPWLTVCVLICEDLARQDPMAEVVRSVGPNLVIALLMDGPQLASRWAARYASVLAEDPGSSVLTLTSVGMTQLSRAPGKPTSRVIALWKDALSSSPVEVELPDDHAGVVLSLSVQYLEEFTADGRTDRKNSGYPILAGIHPIAVKPPSPLV
ncbi:MAG TPA: hypothetical protein VG944_23855 [Fimbriimonas sp.]|nr:hypothetical protein [Fimbriimonas sp.]